MKMTIILETDDEGLWARIEGIPNFLPNTYGASIAEVEANMRAVLDDYAKHEGKHDPVLAGITVAGIDFDYAYDLEAFFEQYNVVKISEVARLAGLNPSLVRQYASGVKHAPEKAVRQIEAALHRLGKTLMEVQLV